MVYSLCSLSKYNNNANLGPIRTALVGGGELESETELVALVGGQIHLGGQVQDERVGESVLDGSSKLALVVQLGTESHVTAGRVLRRHGEHCARASDLPSEGGSDLGVGGDLVVEGSSELVRVDDVRVEGVLLGGLSEGELAVGHLVRRSVERHRRSHEERFSLEDGGGIHDGGGREGDVGGETGSGQRPVGLQLAGALSGVGGVGGVEGDLEASAELLVHLDDGAELVVGVPLLGESHALLGNLVLDVEVAAELAGGNVVRRGNLELNVVLLSSLAGRVDLEESNTISLAEQVLGGLSEIGEGRGSHFDKRQRCTLGRE
ncbi:hypothetical protein PENTCL1PPCAC_18946, partial [Pristionchus entomophagus]